jgi:hypothetical protein
MNQNERRQGPHRNSRVSERRQRTRIPRGQYADGPGGGKGEAWGASLEGGELLVSRRVLGEQGRGEHPPCEGERGCDATETGALELNARAR